MAVCLCDESDDARRLGVNVQHWRSHYSVYGLKAIVAYQLKPLPLTVSVNFIFIFIFIACSI